MKSKLLLKVILIFTILSVSITGCANNNNGASSSSSISTSTSSSKTATNISGNGSATSTKTNENTNDISSKDSEKWANTGTITLGNQITYTGNGIEVSGTTVNIKAGGDYTITGTLTDGMIYVDTEEDVKLRLNGVDITNSKGPAIFFQNAKKAFITVEEGTTNNLTDGSSYSVEAKGTIFSNDTLEIKGKGVLNVTGNYKHGIASDDDIIIENGLINVTSIKDGLHANDNVTMTGGILNIKCESDGIESEGDIIIEDGQLTIDAGDDGIHAETNLTVNGGTINVTNSYEGLEGKNALIVNSGNIRIKAGDDGLNAGSNIEINDGYIYVDCEGDGYDSNGSMTINGGTSIIYSGNNANGSMDIEDRTGTFAINGGTIIAAGGPMSITVSENSKQYSMWINSQVQSNELVNVSNEDGSEIITFALLKGESSILVSTDKLVANGTYNISTGGSHSGTLTDGIYSGGAYTGGTALGSVTMTSKSVSYGQSSGMPGGGGKGGGAPRPQ